MIGKLTIDEAELEQLLYDDPLAPFCCQCGEYREDINEYDMCPDCEAENDMADFLFTGGDPRINDQFIKADYDRKIAKGE